MEINNYSPLTLAFLGDSIYELYIREYLVRKGNTAVEKLHNAKIKLVCCEAQALLLCKILPILTEDENAIYKRGRNAKVTAPKNAKLSDYHNATGLECLVGYLYLTEQKKRLNEILEYGLNFLISQK